MKINWKYINARPYMIGDTVLYGETDTASYAITEDLNEGWDKTAIYGLYVYNTELGVWSGSSVVRGGSIREVKKAATKINRQGQAGLDYATNNWAVMS